METLITQADGALGWSFFFCLACCLAYRLWKRPLLRFANTLIFQKIRRRSNGGGSGGAIGFALICAIFFLLMGMRLNAGPTVEKYNVRVLRSAGFNQWEMEDDQGRFLYTACDDFPNSKVIWAGYIARKVRWQEFGSCKSIRRQDLGFWWDRDENLNAKEIH